MSAQPIDGGICGERTARSGPERAALWSMSAWAAIALSVAACGGEDSPKKADADAASDGAGAGAETADDLARVADIDEPDSAARSDAAGTDLTVNDAAPADEATPDVPPDVPLADLGQDVPTPVDIAQCATGTDCAGLLKLQPCEQATCVAGQCKPEPKPDQCCTDADCNDQGECVAGKCDTGAHACLYTPIPNCCSGKVTLLKTSLEGAPFEDVSAQESPQNGNVAWGESTTRAHSGKKALYFGNACKTYDNSLNVANGCKVGGASTPIQSALTTKEHALPKDKKAQLHFWLWLDTESPYADTLPKGTCATPCVAGAACIQVNGQSQCVPEKDVLTVSVLQGETATSVFSSLQIGKSTKGQWLHVAVDLSKWAGHSIKAQWAFATGTNLKNGYEGIYLDDLVIETNCTEKGAFCDEKAPCQDDANACTQDVCTKYANNAGLGVCFADKKVGCCTVVSECADGNACTLDACNASQCSWKPDATKPACCKAEVLAPLEDFESGTLDVWSVFESNSTISKWRLHPTGGNAGQALYFGTEGLDTYADPALGKDLGPKGTICMDKVKIKQGSLHDLVTFDLQMETEWTGLPATTYKNPPVAGGKKFDALAVSVYHNGTFTEVWSSDAVLGTTGGQWLPVTVALDAFQGQTVQLCFAFDAGDGAVNDKAGVRLDNVLVKVACSKKPCYFATECKALSCGTCKVPICDGAGCQCVAVPDCCTAAQDCDDGETKCTIDKCGADGKCVHEPTGFADCPNAGGK
ncbi:MAG: hypothetical protein EXR79_02085 [Myxococcales bacterium]|nr:hypothetical protein [Myxococcales bacterium]